MQRCGLMLYYSILAGRLISPQNMFWNRGAGSGTAGLVVKTNHCGYLWVLYPLTWNLPPKLSVFIEFLAKCLSQETTLNAVTDGNDQSSLYEEPEAR